jgi:short-subunit dehydrogenase involved in D-alanine esterification of teichoic acids
MFASNNLITIIELATKLTNILFTSVIQGCVLAHNHFSEQLKSYPDREFCIVNTSSVAAFEAIQAVPLYSICKRGVRIYIRFYIKINFILVGNGYNKNFITFRMEKL